MVSHVFMADVGHSGQILYHADSAWSCVGNDMCSVDLKPGSVGPEL